MTKVLQKIYLKLVFLSIYLFCFNISAQETYRDEFNNVAYNNNNGSLNWSTNWIEDNDNNAAPNGKIEVDDRNGEFFLLEFNDLDVNDESIRRSVNLTGATSATLSFNWETLRLDGTGIGTQEQLDIQVSADGTTFTTIGRLTGSQTGTFSEDISAFISANTTIRFINLGTWVNAPWENNEFVFIDNIEIEAIFQPQISINDVTVNETDGTATFTVSHTGSTTTSGFTLEFFTSNNTANAPEDFGAAGPPNQILNFAGTTLSDQTINISINNDTFLEANETFFVNLSNPSDPSIVITDNQGVGTILANDPASLAINDITVNEGDGTATLTVSLTGNVDSSFTVEYSTTDVSTTAGADYTGTVLPLPTITFNGNTTNETQQIVIPILDDGTAEMDEVFTVNLGAVSNPLITISDNQGNVTIEDNDAGISIADQPTINENIAGGAVSFVVTHTGVDIPGGFTITYNTTDGSAISPNDYTAVTTPLILNFSGVSGETQNIVIPIIDDAVPEVPENFFVNLISSSNSNITFTDNQAIGTIIDDTPPILITTGTTNTCSGIFTDTGGFNNNYSDNENFTFTLCPDPANPGSTIIVDFSEFNIETGFDFFQVFNGVGTTTLIGAFTNANPPTQLISTDATGCLTFTFTSDFIFNFGGWIAEIQCANNFVDITDVTVNENAGTATFTATLLNTVPGGFDVDFSTVDGTAFAVSDYTETNGTLNFTGTAGESFNITVPIIDNTFLEPDETFTIELTNYTVPNIVTRGGTGTITDDATDTAIPFNVPLTLFENFNGYFDYALTGDSFRNDPADECSITPVKPPVPLTTPILPGATIERAFLYWSHSGATPDDIVTFEGQQVTADIINGATIGTTPFYGMLSDVTSIINTIPNPSTNLYDVSNLSIDNNTPYCSTTGSSIVVGGWSLIIIYSEPTTLPAVSINVYNGFDGQQNNTTSYNLSGFFAIGSSGSKTSVLSWEGDVGLANNESLNIEVGLNPGVEQPLVGDGDNDGTIISNPFNSTLFDNTTGTNVNRVTLGMDFDTYDVSPFINTGESSVRTEVNVGTDFVILNAVLLKVPSNLIIGNVFEDLNYGGGIGRDQATSSGVSLPNVTVELFRENPLGSGTFTFEDSTTTDTTGEYVFGGMANGNYRVKVINNTVRSSRVGGNTCITCLPIQTFRRNYSTITNSFSDVNMEIGGANPANEDVTVIETLANSQTVSEVTIENEGVIGLDFGFNFNTIVNTNSSGQGSLAQFITNSNILENATLNIEANSIFDPALTEDTSIFMIPPVSDPFSRTADPNYNATTGVFDIAILNAEDLPIITGNNTIIDGRTQTAYSSDTNPGVIGASTNSVGTNGTPLPSYNLPEIQVHQNNGDVFQLNSSLTTIRDIAIYSNNNGGILIQGGNATITNNLIGTDANGNNSGDIDNGIEISGFATNSTIRNNYIATNSNAGIIIRRGASTLITENHLNTNGNDSCSDNIVIRNNSLNVSITNNLIEGAGGYGIDANELATGDLTLTNNTIRESGRTQGDCFGAIENAGIILGGSNSSLINNIINNNNGPGIVLTRGNTQGNVISQNSIYANGTSTTKELGIELNANAAFRVFDGTTLNETGDTDNGPNELLNFPIIETSTISGNIVTVTGWTRPGTILEFFLSDISLGTSDIGDNQLTPRITDYGEGQLFIGSVTEGSIDDLDTTVSTYNFDGNNDTTNRFRFNITISNQVPVIRNFITATATNANNSTSEFSPISQLTIASVITNRRITYRVGFTEPDNGITGNLTKNITLLNFQDGNNGSNFDLTFKNNTATAIANYQILIQKTPYNTIPGLILGSHTLNTITNLDGTFNHIITSTTPLNPNEIRSITGTAPASLGTGISCGCVTFYE